MKKRNGLRSAMTAAAAALALLVGTAQATTKWCVGGGSGAYVRWDQTTSWSTVQTSTTPHPGSIPGAADVAVFDIDGQGSANHVYCCLQTDQFVSGLVFRTTPYTYLTTDQAINTNCMLTIGSGGITALPGAGAFWDYVAGITLSFGTNQTWVNKGGAILSQYTALNGNGYTLALIRGTLQIGGASGAATVYAACSNVPSITVAEGGTLSVYNPKNSPINIIDRIGDATDIVSYGGGMFYYCPQSGITSYIFTESVNTLRLVKGAFTHEQDCIGGTSISNVFTYSGVTRVDPTTTLDVYSGVRMEYFGDMGAHAHRLILGGQPTTNFIGGWAFFPGTDSSDVQTGGFAAYDTTMYGGFPRGVYRNPGAALTANLNDGTAVCYLSGSIAETADSKVLALSLWATNNASLKLGGHALTVVSGGLNLDRATVANVISGGTLTAGTGSDTNLFAFCPATPINQNTFPVQQTYATNNIKIIDAVIADNGGGKIGLVKSGGSALTLTQPNTFSGNTTVNEGSLYLSTAGSIANSPTIELLWGTPNSGARLDVSAQTSTWTLGASQTLMGNGAVIGNVNVSGTVAPGVNTNLAAVAGTGMLTVTGTVAFANNATLRVNVQNAINAGDQWGDANTWGAGYGRLKVFGNVNLGTNAILDVESVGTPSLTTSNNLFIIDNRGANPVSGQFKTPAGCVLNDGDVFTAAGTNFQIRYTGNVSTLTTNGGYSVVIQVTSQASTTASKGTVVMFK